MYTYCIIRILEHTVLISIYRSAIHRPAVGSTPLALKDSGFLQIRGVPSAQAKPAPVVPRPTRRPDTLRTHTLIQSQAKPKLGSTTNTQKIFSDEGSLVKFCFYFEFILVLIHCILLLLVNPEHSIKMQNELKTLIYCTSRN